MRKMLLFLSILMTQASILANENKFLVAANNGITQRTQLISIAQNKQVRDNVYTVAQITQNDLIAGITIVTNQQGNNIISVIIIPKISMSDPLIFSNEQLSRSRSGKILLRKLRKILNRRRRK